MARFRLERVHYMPKELAPGVLYVSDEFAIAGHLCACGCGNKVMTPLGPAEWRFEELRGDPSLAPSIGNWQWPCQSHYWITRGEVIWAPKWTPTQIETGRRSEEERRQAYYRSRERKRRGLLATIWAWLKGLLSRHP